MDIFARHSLVYLTQQTERKRKFFLCLFTNREVAKMVCTNWWVIICIHRFILAEYFVSYKILLSSREWVHVRTW